MRLRHNLSLDPNPPFRYTDKRKYGFTEKNMNANYQVQVGRRGVITLPKELRDQNNIADGEILNLIELSENVIVISRRRSQVDEVANKLAKEWQDSGETLESMLKTLREVRAEYDDKKP
jgi:AbrB family looped-hinge helix DNA binding protein